MQSASPSISPKAERDLQWAKVLEAVAGRCRGPLAARFSLPLAQNQEETRHALEETTQLQRLLAEDEVLPLEGAADLRAALTRLEREGALDAPMLRDLKKTLGVARLCRRFLSARRDTLRPLEHSIALDPSLDGLAEEVDFCISDEGHVRDDASPTLKSLRNECANLRARIVSRLESIIHKRADVLQDSFHTIREGRHVLPVRRDTHEKLPGIVHGTSASGATVFVEPHALVEQGNRLRMAEAEAEREEARILADLSDLARDRVPEIRAACDSIDHLDRRQAGALLGREWGAECLELSERHDIELKSARHPVLLLDGVDVVPSDLHIESGRALVISGPNAGGKTVALKTLGLAALMTRAGLPFPAKEGRCGFFSDIATDVGDDQSLAKNLSTFSAHVTNLSSILNSVRPGVLVLLDELAGGTDPLEGSALAAAMVDALCRKGAALVVTTHYESLKTMATRDERLDNAAVGFDVAKMEPTFELTHGMPGPSSALRVASRYGIPKDVIDYAESVLPEESKNFDEVIRQLDDSRAELARAKADVEDQRRRLRAEFEALQKDRRELRSRGKSAVDKESARLLDEIKRARHEMTRARKHLKRQQDQDALELAKKRAEEAQAAMPKPQYEKPEGNPVSTLSPGDRVFVPSLRSTAVVLEEPVRGEVRIAAGPLKLRVRVDELYESGDKSKNTNGTEEPKRTAKNDAPAMKDPQTDRNTLDLRGLRVEDALSLTESFLDRVYGAQGHTAYIVHGVGSGALRDAIRTQLKDDKRYVKSFREGTRDEGGGRLTVVSLR